MWYGTIAAAALAATTHTVGAEMTASVTHIMVAMSTTTTTTTTATWIQATTTTPLPYK